MTAARNNKNNTIVITGIVVLVVIVIVAAFLNRQLSWAETYEPDDNNPYGTQVLYELLKVSRSDQSFIKVADTISKDLPIDPTDKEDSYLFIGNDLYADSNDVERIMKFVQAGNSAFIFTFTPHHLVTDSLLRGRYSSKQEVEESVVIEEDNLVEEDYEDSSDYENYSEEEQIDEYYNEYIKQESDRLMVADHYSDTTVNIRLNEFNQGKSYYDLVRKYKDKKRLSDWFYFQENIVTYHGDSVKHLGTIDKSYSNYIKFKYGKGYFYLHTTPLVFTNYYMINDTTMNYCRDALSYLGNGNIYWDEENRTYDYKAANHHSQADNPSKPSEGPLEFILSEPSLKAAWYLILAGTVLYLMFGAKRKQRIVQPMENMENTSIEYAEVISQMFMKQSDHKKLVSMKMDLFRSFLRDRFRIKLPSNRQEESENLYNEIALKSNISADLVQDIFDNYNYLNTIVQVETAEMLAFHNKLEHFYNNCK